MIFIGERINAGFKEIKRAINEKDGDIIKETAIRQAKAGANYIDVNLGTASNKPDDLCWMIEMVQAAVDLPISIDNNTAITGGTVTKGTWSARANAFYSWTKSLDLGGEIALANREIENGNEGDMTRFQFMAKYGF